MASPFASQCAASLCTVLEAHYRVSQISSCVLLRTHVLWLCYCRVEFVVMERLLKRQICEDLLTMAYREFIKNAEAEEKKEKAKH